MPTKERKYWRQNLERATGHVDDIQGYLIAVGSGFIEQGQEHYGDDMEIWPEDYKKIIGYIDTFIELCQSLREGIGSLRDSF